MTDERALGTDNDEPLTEDDLAMHAVELPDRAALSIVAPSGVAGPQPLLAIGLLPAADAEAVPDPGMDG